MGHEALPGHTCNLPSFLPSRSHVRRRIVPQGFVLELRLGQDALCNKHQTNKQG
jgi:hypothetical protein